MSDKLMYMPNDDTQNYPSVDYNYWLKRLDNEPKFNRRSQNDLANL